MYIIRFAHTKVQGYANGLNTAKTSCSLRKDWLLHLGARDAVEPRPLVSEARCERVVCTPKLRSDDQLRDAELSWLFLV